MGSNEEVLDNLKSQLIIAIRTKESLEYAAVTVRAKGNRAAETLFEIADQFGRDANDLRIQIDEVEKHIKGTKI